MKTIKKRILLRNISTSGTTIRATQKEHINFLVKDISLRGLVVPIVCCAKNKKSKRVYIADGFLRLKAYKIVNSRKPKSRRRKTINVLFCVDETIAKVRQSHNSFFSFP